MGDSSSSLSAFLADLKLVKLVMYICNSHDGKSLLRIQIHGEALKEDLQTKLAAAGDEAQVFRQLRHTETLGLLRTQNEHNNDDFFDTPGLTRSIC